ncbi:MAG: PEP-CTERM sorting domain-containing protein [Pirellulales bacterium]|nr:PEP-CTERM sorting domain-containing protein [Pirellulales bacterium]
MSASPEFARLSWCLLLRGSAAVVFCATVALSAHAQNWNEVDFLPHSDFQAVRVEEAVVRSAYTAGFPLRLRGVVLNDNEDWLDPTADYDPGPEVHLWQLGGQAEIFVQAVDLPGDTWDDGDFGGTACWMGQNYGNHVIHQDAIYSYTDAEWYAELDRLHLWREESAVVPLVRAGDLVEIRAWAGLYYGGKMNVNEQHNRNSGWDFEIEILQQGYGLPTPEEIALSALKDAADVALFDPTRATGGERYQATLVEIQNVRLTDDSGWSADADLTVTDDTGRTLEVHLGRDESFQSCPAPAGWFNVTGILNQESDGGTDGYRLLVMHAGHVSPIPEPTTLTLLVAGAAMLAFWVRRRPARRNA